MSGSAGVCFFPTTGTRGVTCADTSLAWLAWAEWCDTFVATSHANSVGRFRLRWTACVGVGAATASIASRYDAEWRRPPTSIVLPATPLWLLARDSTCGRRQ